MRSMAKKLVSKMLRATSSLSGARRPGDVEPQGLYADLLDGGGVSCAGVDLAGTAGEQLARKRQADAAIGTCDEDNGILDLHGELQKNDGWKKQAHLILMTTLPFARPAST
jgi:hypothetical protein